LTIVLGEEARARQRAELIDALRAPEGSKARAARRLQIPRTTLHDRIRRFGLG